MVRLFYLVNEFYLSRNNLRYKFLGGSVYLISHGQDFWPRTVQVSCPATEHYPRPTVSDEDYIIVLIVNCCGWETTDVESE